MKQIQIDATKKLNKILMGNGGDYRSLKLYNIRDLLNKEQLTEDDVLVLQHFLMADKQTIENTAYVANTAVYPASWGHSVTVLKRKNSN
jgi:hypothetical protein